MKDFFILYSNCIPVLGFKRAMIVDLQNNVGKFYPNILLKMLQERKPVSALKKAYNTDEGLDRYLGDIASNGLGFFCDEIDTFPLLDMDWKSPSQITNAIIELKDFVEDKFKSIIQQLEDLGCFALQVKIENNDDKDITAVLEILKYSKIRAIEILFLSDVKLEESQMDLINDTRKFHQIVIFNCEKDEVANKIDRKSKSFEEALCSKSPKDRFNINIQHFTESQCHNTCLNRKMSIDGDGYIKHCPYMKDHYGNTSNTSLKEVIEKANFTDYWLIKKDKIDVCQDCEFRHICTDCRAYLKDPNDLYSQPKNCDYNPYIAKWEGEEGWVSVVQWRSENPDWEEQAKTNRTNLQPESQPQC